MKSITLVSFNIRVVADDGINSWCYRKSHVIKHILTEKPDVIGFQELTATSLKGLKKAMPDYVFVGCGRDKDYTGEAVMLAYHKSCIDLVSLENFWLSDTPRVAGSRYEESSVFPRYFSVAVFKVTDSNQLFRVYNTHYDHESTIARLKSSHQLLKHLELTQTELLLPTFIMGDLNAEPDAAEIKLLETSKEVALKDLTQHLEYTFHAYGETKAKIDYIFATQEVTCHEVLVWDESHDGVYLSDHYPILTKVTL